MGKAIHILAFTALLILGVSVTDASSIGEASSQAEASAYSYADSSSEEDYCDNTKCKKPNEVYDVCPPSCPARVCGIDDRAIKCKPQPKPGDKNCNKPACRCKNGYYRDNKGNCVEWKKCPQCPANEVYDPCDAPCPERTCAFDPTVVRCAAPPKIGDPACVVGCRCIDGYLRNDKGVCVPQDQCGKTNTQTCKKNEILVECPISKCNVQTCDQLGFEVACPAVACSGVFGCICKDGYLRNSNGVCIPQEQCPSCGGDANAKPGCGGNCGKKCSDLGKSGPRVCPLACRLNGCDCKDGYYYDETKNKCVLPSECTTPPSCRANEVLSSCANGGCRRRKCTDLDGPILCIDPIKCEQGCICADGYYLDANGNCVSEEECRKGKCSKQNEVYDQCYFPCYQATCDYTPRPELVKCPCVAGCRCRDGYVRNNDGDCIRKEECVKKCTKPNEVYDECPASCPPRVCGIDDTLIDCKPQPIPGDPDCNKPACRCKDGYYRDNKGNCVLWKHCPKCTKPNEIYDPCDSPCPERTCSFDPRVVRCAAPPKIGDPACVIGCRCEDGYLRNDKGICVPQDQCTQTCNANEVLVKCPIAACRPNTCAELGFPVACPTIIGECPSKPACLCVGGYVRNSDGVCIPATECPSCGGDVNAQAGCGSNCGKMCSDLSNTEPYSCPMGCRLYGCNCKDGFYYNEDTKKCVPPNECPNFQQANSTCSAYTGSVTALTVGNNLFTAKFLYQLMKVNPGTNVIASAFSVLHILANLFLYTKGDTSTEIMKILNVKTKEEIRCAFTQFLDIVQSKEVELSLASKIFLAKKFSLSPSFKKDTNEIFRASAESIDFEKSTDAANTINNWVSDATKGKIKDLVTARMFDLYTRLVLTNAIYFKGAWKQQFNLQSTKKDKFYVNSKKTKKVDMMQLRSSLYYYDHPDLDAKTVALPYKDSNVTFVVILPNKIDGLSNLVEKLQVDNNFDTAVATFAYGPVNLFMPKFEISTTTNLAKLLKQIGVKTIFTDDAQLDGMIIPNQPLKVSAAVQKAFIVVDEKGSEAAAANAFVVRHRITSARKPPKDFILRVDHPFVYAIKVQKTIVFCGLYSG